MDAFSTFSISTLPEFPNYAQIKMFLIDGWDDIVLGLRLETQEAVLRTEEG